MWSALATIVASVATALLKSYWARQDQTDKVRLELAAEMEAAYRASLEYKIRMAADPRDIAKLQSLGKRIPLPSEPPASPGS